MEKVDFFFLFFALAAVVFSLGVVLFPSPLLCALSLVASLGSIAAIFVLLEAYLVAIFQILLYAGAVVVLFVFVLMLFRFREEHLELPSLGTWRGLGLLVGGMLCVLFYWTWRKYPLTGLPGGHTAFIIEEEGGNLEVFSQYLFSKYVLPFEMVSLLLLVAVVGSVILARRKS